MDEMKVRNLVIGPEQREFTKTFQGDKEAFTIRMPLPFEKSQIISLTARAAGGQDYKSMPEDDYEYIRMIVTLNSCIIKNPSWWPGAEKCPDESLLFDLWKWFMECEKAFQEALKKNIGPKAMEGGK